MSQLPASTSKGTQQLVAPLSSPVLQPPTKGAARAPPYELAVVSASTLATEPLVEYLQSERPAEGLGLAQLCHETNAACMRLRGRVVGVVPMEPNDYGGASWEVTIEYPEVGGGRIWSGLVHSDTNYGTPCAELAVRYGQLNTLRDVLFLEGLTPQNANRTAEWGRVEAARNVSLVERLTRASPCAGGFEVFYANSILRGATPPDTEVETRARMHASRFLVAPRAAHLQLLTDDDAYARIDEELKWCAAKNVRMHELEIFVRPDADDQRINGLIDVLRGMLRDGVLANVELLDVGSVDVASNFVTDPLGKFVAEHLLKPAAVVLPRLRHLQVCTVDLPDDKDGWYHCLPQLEVCEVMDADDMSGLIPYLEGLEAPLTRLTRMVMKPPGLAPDSGLLSVKMPNLETLTYDDCLHVEDELCAVDGIRALARLDDLFVDGPLKDEDATWEALLALCRTMRSLTSLRVRVRSWYEQDEDGEYDFTEPTRERCASLKAWLCTNARRPCAWPQLHLTVYAGHEDSGEHRFSEGSYDAMKGDPVSVTDA